MDRPEQVSHLVVMDAVPILEALERCDERFALAWYHWFFFAQEAPRPEMAILADPDTWYGMTGKAEAMGQEAFDDIRRAIHDPHVVHAMLEDYRAGLGIDRLHDAEDRRSGRRVRCPTLAIWALRDDLVALYGDPLIIWRNWVDDLAGHAVDCGHHIAEEAPDALAAALLSHLAEMSPG